MLDTPAAAAAAANTTRFRDKWRVTYHHRPTQEHLSFSVVGAPTAPGKLGDLQMQPLHSSSSLRCFSGSPQHSLNTHHKPPPRAQTSIPPSPTNLTDPSSRRGSATFCSRQASRWRWDSKWSSAMLSNLAQETRRSAWDSSNFFST